MVEDFDEGPLEPDERRRYDRSRLIVDVFFDGNDATGVAPETNMCSTVSLPTDRRD